jgi:hypothetical protein
MFKDRYILLKASLLFAFLLIFFSVHLSTTYAWIDSGWQYRKSHTIVAASGAGTDYQVKITAHYGPGVDSGNDVYLGGKSKTDFSDLRFSADDGATPLPYWIESKTDSDNAVVWVKISADISSSNATIYIYYGNAGASSASDGTNTFLFFDDFNTNLSKWSVEKTSGIYPQISTTTNPTYVRSGGGSTGAPYGHTSLGSSPTFTGFNDNAMGFMARNGSSGIGEVAFRGSFAGNTGYKARLDQRSGEGSSFLKPPYTDGTWGFLAGCTGDADPPTADTWYKYEVAAFGSDFKIYRNGTLKKSCSDAQYASAGEIAFQNHYGDHVDYDWVYVRKFQSSEPTNGAWGVEATAPVTTSGGVMSSNNYTIRGDSINFAGNLSTSTSYSMQDTLGEIATGVSSSTNYVMNAGYQQMLQSYISISVTGNPALPAMGGISSGFGNSSTTYTVITDNPAGYSLSVVATGTPAMQGQYGDNIADYVPAGSVPDYNFTVAATSSMFGFNPLGVDVVSRYKNDGATTCNTGSLNTLYVCWDGFSTSPRIIAQSAVANQPSGATTTVNYEVKIGASKIQTSGTYAATITVTAVTL